MKQLIIVLSLIVAFAFIWWQATTVDLIPGLGQEPDAAVVVDEQESAGPAAEELPSAVDRVVVDRAGPDADQAKSVASSRVADPVEAVAPLKFLVVDGGGDPVDRAEVTVFESRNRERGLQLWVGATDAIGRAVASVAGDTLLVSAYKPGVGWSGDVYVTREAAGSPPHRVVLLATARVRGTVLRIDERPANRLLVHGRSTGFDGERCSQLPPAVTDEQGVFECEVLAGRQYAFSAKFDGRWSRGGAVPELKSGALFEVTLRFPGAYAIGGTLRDATGALLAGQVWVIRRDAKGLNALHGARVGDDGRFEIELVEGGTFDVVGGAKGRTSAHVTVALDESTSRSDDLELRTQPFAVVSGRVVDETGTPLARVMVGVGYAVERDALHIQRSQLHGNLPIGPTAADGTFNFRAPADYRCQLVARPVPGNRELLVRGAIFTAPASDLKLVIRAADRDGFFLVGQVTGPDGQPIAGGKVYRVKHQANGGSSMGRVGDIRDGGFEVGPLATGQRVSFEFQTKEFPPHRVGPFETTVRREQLAVRMSRYGGVRCRVQRPDGTPAVQAFVSLGYEPPDPFGPAWQGKTDDQGAIEFERVIPRSYRVNARAPTAAGGKGRGDIHVVGGQVVEVDVVLAR